MLLLQPSRQTIALNCWNAGQWAAPRETALKAGSFTPATANRLRIEVAGSHIRVFLNKSLACEFDDNTVPGPGALGLCIVSMSTAPGAAYFDNLVVKDTRPGADTSPPAVTAARTPAPGPVWMGINLEDEFARQPDPQGMIRPLGVRIVGTWPGEPADKAGLKKADIITKIDGKPVADLRAYDRCLDVKNPGDGVVVVFIRGNERKQARVTLMAEPPDSVTDPKLPTLAQKGEAWAQVELGDVYHNGRGVPRDDVKAVAWYYKAAVQGDNEGQTSMGDSYLAGEGVTRDASVAFRWYKLAAAKGYPPAQVALGNLYASGTGVKENDAQAVKWYLQAAGRGNAQGLHNLGWAYQKGSGVKRDTAKAVSCYRSAAERGEPAAKHNLAIMYTDGDVAEPKPGEAVKLLREAAAEGEIDALATLGEMFETGKGVAQDYSEAVKCYHQAAEKHSALGQVKLGYMCVEGKGVQRDYATALGWFRLAVDQNSALGQRALAVMYDNGWGVPANHDQAVVWFRKASAQGDEDARKYLANLGVQP
jgi:TPR repeat protein